MYAKGKVFLQDKVEQQLIETGEYYDVLHEFTETVRKINEIASDGEKVKILQTKCMRILPAFVFCVVVWKMHRKILKL